MRNTNPGEVAPLLPITANPTTTNSNTVSRRISHCVTATSFHSLDMMRIWLVTQSLSARFLYQLFIELDRYDVAPSEGTRKQWLGWPVIGATFIIAAAAKIANAVRDKNSKPAQDYIFTLFSSSIIYMGLDIMSSDKGAEGIPLPVFIIASVLVPLLAIKKWIGTIHDSTKQVVDYSHDKFPTYNVNKAHRALNALPGLSYCGSAATTLIWTVSREIANRTVSIKLSQGVVAALFAVAGGSFGLTSSEHPKAFNRSVAIAKTIKDGALSYSALSGIAFHLLHAVHQCEDNTCWDESVHTYLTVPVAIMAAAVGVHSGMTTLFDFDASYDATKSNADKLISVKKHTKQFIQDPAGTSKAAAKWAGTKLSNARDSVFNKCKGSCACCGQPKREASDTVPLNQLSQSQAN